MQTHSRPSKSPQKHKTANQKTVRKFKEPKGK